MGTSGHSSAALFCSAAGGSARLRGDVGMKGRGGDADEIKRDHLLSACRAPWVLPMVVWYGSQCWRVEAIAAGPLTCLRRGISCSSSRFSSLTSVLPR